MYRFTKIILSVITGQFAETMRMSRPVRDIGIIGALICYFVVAGCGSEKRTTELVPLRDCKRSEDISPMHVIVLNTTDAVEVMKPFKTAKGENGRSDFFSLPEGVRKPVKAGTTGKPFSRGYVRYNPDVPRSDNYFTWMRVKWNDSCGNSISLVMDDNPPKIIGQDAIYNQWHWIPAGSYKLTQGKHTLSVWEREDGVAFDKILLTESDTFIPSGTVGPEIQGDDFAGVRQFGDDFSRSPGHGIQDWEVLSGNWDIEFSFDPNRIPNQYSLVGQAATGESAELVLKDKNTWDGFEFSFSVSPVENSIFGIAVTSECPETDGNVRSRKTSKVKFNLSEDKRDLEIKFSQERKKIKLGNIFRPRQWHRITLRYWGTCLSVIIDDHEMFFSGCLNTNRKNSVVFQIDRGMVVFDDVRIKELKYSLDDYDCHSINWEAGDNAEWYRPRKTIKGNPILIGTRGNITFPKSKLPIRELFIQYPALMKPLEIAGFRIADSKEGNCRYLPLDGSAYQFQLQAGKGSIEINRVDVLYDQQDVDQYRFGPFHFTRAKIEDPADYLDFTEQEYRQIADSSDIDKLRRLKKFIPLVGKNRDITVWIVKRGLWRVHPRNGNLVNRKGNDIIQFSQQTGCDLIFKLRFCFPGAGGCFKIRLYQGGAQGINVEVKNGKPYSCNVSKQTVSCSIPTNRKWHDLILKYKNGTLSVCIDDWKQTGIDVKKGEGDFIRLQAVSKKIEFDDIEILVDRKGEHEYFYSFDRRETDWWRYGTDKWLDHGGISCALASNWISLVSPDGNGTLWNKRLFKPDLMVSFYIRENTEWYGWKKKPSHTHYPFDNVQVFLSEGQNSEKGYRLEVNAENRTETALYRNGVKVKTVRQDKSFPIRYRGGHAPYSPRKNRISLLKKGNVLKGFVNGKIVLEYQDPDPVTVDSVGVGGYKTRINFSNIEIKEL